MVNDDASRTDSRGSGERAEAVERLLEQILESGESPEDVCRLFPELLPDVRAGLLQLRELDEEVGALFPPSHHSDSVASNLLPTELPAVPGYEVLGILGRGGMGIVFRARHLRLKRSVALKMILGGTFTLPSQRERFLREAASIAGISHPNIVQVHNAGECDGRPWFTMELVGGGSLAQRIHGTPQPIKESADTVATLAEAIAVAHRHGIVHRDLKPANILLTADGTPKVTDFGLARSVDDAGATLGETPIGTPSYMAPEQARAAKELIGPATDVYGLGAILYELLTGRAPFRAESSTATLQQVLHEEIVPPARLNPRTPRDLETICLKCLQKEPAARYPDAATLAGDLRRFLRNEPIRARRIGPVGRIVRWSRRQPAAAALFATSILTVALAMTVTAQMFVERHQRRLVEQAVQDDLHQITRFEQQGAWGPAESIAQRAEGRLAAVRGVEALRHQLQATVADLKLARHLEQIRLKGGDLIGGQLLSTTIDSEYAAVFGRGQLDILDQDPLVAARKLSSSAIIDELLTALDDWAARTQDASRQSWCLTVARQTDPVPDEWRYHVRDPIAWSDRSVMNELVARCAVERQPVELLVAVGARLAQLKIPRAEFLKRVQSAHPSDFWANWLLANTLVGKDPNESIAYYSAAIAARPGEVISRNNLGMALKATGRLDEAIVMLRGATEVDPSYAPAYSNLGLAYKAKGDRDRATECFRKAIKLDPTFAHAYANLGNALRANHDLQGALEQYQRAATLNLNSGILHYDMALLFKDMQRPDVAERHFRKAIEMQPKLFQAHADLGASLREQGRLEESIEQLQIAVELAPTDAKSHRTLAKSLTDSGRIGEAIAHQGIAFDLAKDYLAAAQMYADQFAAHPDVMEDLSAGNRCRAARVAMLAASGIGEGAAALSPEQRAQWRRQARDWLRADVAAAARALDGNATTRPSITQLSRVRDDADYAILRDAALWSKFDASEESDWLNLWRDLGRLLARADRR